MPYVEQMLYGVENTDNSAGREVLAKSPGLGTDATTEIATLCDRWGAPPALGLAQPVLMSFRLAAEIPSIRGRLYAVIQASRGFEQIFHAAVISESAYVTFMRNPFALRQVVDFLEDWKPGLRLNRLEVNYDHTRPLVDPPVSAKDIGLVDEAVSKYITDGTLSLPLEQPSSESDRSLALIIACLPEKDRKELRFASFATSDGNNYSLFANESDGGDFSGWRRLMMTWLAGDYVDETDSYIKSIRTYMERGDLVGVTRVTSRQPARPMAPGKERIDPFVVDRFSPGVAAEDTPQAKVTRPPLPKSPSRPVAGTPSARKPAPERTEPARRPVKPISAMAVSQPAAEPRPEPIRAPNRTKVSRARRLPVRPPRFYRRVVRGLVALVVICLAGWFGWMWREGYSISETLEWAGLEYFNAERSRTERAATLLEVVDVGGVYDRQLKLVAGAGNGLNPSLDKGRSKAMGNLQEEVGVPLRQQIDLFVKLANDGMQQGSRPDRETQRMRSLAAQGSVLEQEMARLELAWHSLAAQVFWHDLSHLTDKEVAARHDSLSLREKGFQEDARLGLGTTEQAESLAAARAQVRGMASLLTLFNERSYSAEWEKALSTAAASVSPSASRMTRAYRNSAFALVRLKKYERSQAAMDLPFRGEIRDNDWPTAEVRSILPALRSQARMFPKGHAPALLTGTLDLYGVLKKPGDAAAKAAASAEFLTDLEKNAAFRFHPDPYRDYLDRIRFEAAGIRLSGGRDPSSPGDDRYADAADDIVGAFRDSLATVTDPASWDALAANLESGFLSRWAGRLAVASRLDLDRLKASFDTDWAQCMATAARLRTEVKQGRDWTATWTLADQQARALRATYEGPLAQDFGRSVALTQVAGMQGDLYAPVPLEIESVTVRLERDQLTEPTKIRVAFSFGPGGEEYRSDDFKLGPSAPEGSGWVGTGDIGWKAQLAAAQSIRIRILSKDGERTLLVVDCPALDQGEGIAGMLRPRNGEGGSVSLKINGRYWSGLQVPELGPIF
jgi:hypothetical protein